MGEVEADIKSNLLLVVSSFNHVNNGEVASHAGEREPTCVHGCL